MRDNYDFSDAIKNPFAKKLKEEGYTVMIHYGPEDIAESGGEEEYVPLPEEREAFEAYRAAKGA